MLKTYRRFISGDASCVLSDTLDGKKYKGFIKFSNGLELVIRFQIMKLSLK